MNARLPPGRRGGLMDTVMRLVAIVATALVLIASFFVGAFVALALLGILTIVWIVFAIRWWQFKRRWRQASRERTDRDDDGGGPPGSTTVEGDYRVVDRERR